jgi:hypothetical protein
MTARPPPRRGPGTLDPSADLMEFTGKYQGLYAARSVDSLKYTKDGKLKHLSTKQKFGKLLTGGKPEKKVGEQDLALIKGLAQGRFDSNATMLQTFSKHKQDAGQKDGLNRQASLEYVEEFKGQQDQIRADQAHLEQFMARIDLVSNRTLLDGK